MTPMGEIDTVVLLPAMPRVLLEQMHAAYPGLSGQLVIYIYCLSQIMVVIFLGECVFVCGIAVLHFMGGPRNVDDFIFMDDPPTPPRPPPDDSAYLPVIQAIRDAERAYRAKKPSIHPISRRRALLRA